MPVIRCAKSADVPRMLEIYAPYVERTAISLEYDPPSLREFEERFERISSRYPWLVWEEDGDVLGYAYADLALARAAYRWDADLSIYLCEAARGRGIGTALYDRLEALMRRLGYCNLYALITAGNTPSRQFHEGRGFELQGVLKRSGYKFGAWHDVCWYALSLRGDEAPSAVPQCFEPAMFRADAAWECCAVREIRGGERP